MSNKGFYSNGVTETKLEYRLAKEENKKIHNRIRKNRFVKKRWFLANVEFDCQLFRGDSKYPQIKKMTPTKMGRENRILVQQFIKRLDNNENDETSVLWRWGFVDLGLFKKVMKAHMESGPVENIDM